jgi:malonate transporter and related proteins
LQSLLTVAIPFFAIALLGYIAGRTRLLSPASLAGLNGFVYWFALPVLMAVKIGQAPLRQTFDPNFLFAYYGGGLIVLLLALGVCITLFRDRPAVTVLQGLCAIFGNVGYMGLPVAMAAFGPEAILPAVLAVVGDAGVLVVLAIVAIELDLRRGEGARDALRKALRGLLRNPIILAITVGMAVALLGVPWPKPVAAFGDLLGGAAGPCAMFALGGSLSDRKLSETAALGGEVALLCAFKLIAHPIAVALMATYVFPFDPVWTAAAILQAATPIAATVFVLAQIYGHYVAQSSAAVLLSTAGSMVTVSALLFALAP